MVRVELWREFTVILFWSSNGNHILEDSINLLIRLCAMKKVIKHFIGKRTQYAFGKRL